MNEILLHYRQVNPTTWVYLSSLLMIGLFFKFNRFWSVRNLDLILLILLAPGLLLVDFGRDQQREAHQALAARARTVAAEQPPPADGESQEETDSADDENDSDPPVNNDSEPTTSGADQGDVAETQDPTSAEGPQPTRPESGPTSDTTQPPDPTPEEATNEPPTVSASANVALMALAEHAEKGRREERLGFVWLLIAGALLAIRLLLDPTMVRRPLLDPNLSTGGMVFIGCALFVFLMANVITRRPTPDDLQAPMQAVKLMSGEANERADFHRERHGPGYALVFLLPSIPTVTSNEELGPGLENPEAAHIWIYRSPEDGSRVEVSAEYLGVTPDDEVQLLKSDGEELQFSLSLLSNNDRKLVARLKAYTTIAKSMAILSHLAVIVGIVAIGYWHFENIKMGIGAAMLYLLLPYTSQMTGSVDHVLPAALLVWAVLCYRRPLSSGIFVGLAFGTVYYPLFLLPLWVSFYWQRGLGRFLLGLVSMLAVMVVTLFFFTSDGLAFWRQLQLMFGLMSPQAEGLRGVWGLGWDPVYRWTVLAAFVAMCGTLALWPAQKNLGTLLSCSAAVMVATQFWHGYGGGLFMGWYLPLFLLTIFRPNLEDRVALSVLDESWLHRRRRPLGVVKAA